MTRVTGESHFVQGRRYRLDVIEQDAPASVVIRNSKTLEQRVRPGTDREKREDVLQRWYRQLLRDQIPELLAKWEPVIGVDVAACGIKRMKTKWGACNIEARRIWLNLELAKKPAACLEYILVHLLERHHNDRFRAYMNQFLPQWRIHREELNRAPLAHEDWEYLVEDGDVGGGGGRPHDQKYWRFDAPTALLSKRMEFVSFLQHGVSPR